MACAEGFVFRKQAALFLVRFLRHLTRARRASFDGAQVYTTHQQDRRRANSDKLDLVYIPTTTSYDERRKPRHRMDDWRKLGC